MKGFVPAKPEKITENSSINLEEMSILFWDAKRGGWIDNSFYPFDET
jgi:hypothetical protein